jgi:hypothetical protein
MITISVNVSHLLPPGAAVGKDSFPHLAYAVARLAEHGQQTWKAYAGGKPLPNGKVLHARSGRYMRSIQLRKTGDFSCEIYNDAPYASEIERGTPPRDLKKMLNTSFKVRRSKSGKRYLIIPFRWGAPTSQVGKDGKTPSGLRMMPPEVHEAWRNLKASRIKGVGWRASGTGAWDIKTRAPAKVGARSYRWGDRMGDEQLKDLGVHGRMRRHMSGMVHLQNRSGGQGKHGQYLTFRVMTEDSKGWLAPARPGLYPARAVADEMEPLSRAAFEAAVERDVARLLGPST